MIIGPRMQGPFGSTEAGMCNTYTMPCHVLVLSRLHMFEYDLTMTCIAAAIVLLNGTYISPLVTWDSKITTALSMACSADASTSIATINAYALSNAGHYARFIQIATNMYSSVFPSLKGETIPFQRPAATIPTDKLADWPLCRA
jgi:hypothetical protein